MNKNLLKRISKLLLFTLVCCSVSPSFAQDTLLPFHKDIQQFKKQDSLHFPPANTILLIGSSSFTKWVDVQDYFPGYNIVNRGFGGSDLLQVTRYADDIIFPYTPKQIIIYCGENDLAGADTVTAEMVFGRFKQLFQLIRSRLPRVNIGYVSMKPSPSRLRLLPKMVEANQLIKNYLAAMPATAFIDVYNKMFDKNGKVMKHIFLKDKLHMNAKGYAIWQKVMLPYLMPATPPLKGGHGDGPTGVKELLKTKQ